MKPIVALLLLALPAAADPTHYVVAFNSPNSLPDNVDQMVANAGGTIVERIPEIGGIGVVTSNPDFAAAISANPAGKAAALATTTSLAPTLSQADVGIDSSTNNSNASPTGSDAQAMPDSLGFEQWDKKKLNATSTGSYAVQPGRKDVRVFVIDTGADQTHIDVAPNLNVADSISFVPTEP